MFKLPVIEKATVAVLFSLVASEAMRHFSQGDLVYNAFTMIAFQYTLAEDLAETVRCQS